MTEDARDKGGDMIKSGVDIIEVARVEKLMEKPRFADSVFTEAERKWIGALAHRAAGCFAAKEAVSKALGTGIRGFSFKDIEISHNPLGAPLVILHGEAKKMLGEQNLSLSISHERHYAVAFAILYSQTALNP